MIGRIFNRSSFLLYLGVSSMGKLNQKEFRGRGVGGESGGFGFVLGNTTEGYQQTREQSHTGVPPTPTRQTSPHLFP